MYDVHTYSYTYRSDGVTIVLTQLLLKSVKTRNSIYSYNKQTKKTLECFQNFIAFYRNTDNVERHSDIFIFHCKRKKRKRGNGGGGGGVAALLAASVKDGGAAEAHT